MKLNEAIEKVAGPATGPSYAERIGYDVEEVEPDEYVERDHAREWAGMGPLRRY